MTPLDNISPSPSSLSFSASHSETQGQSDANRAGFSRLAVDSRSSLIAYGYPEGHILITDSQEKRSFTWCYPPTKKMLHLKKESKLDATTSVAFESNLQALEWIATKAPLGDQKSKIRFVSVHERDLLVLWNLNAEAERLPKEDCDLPFSSRLVESWIDLSIALAPFPALASSANPVSTPRSNRKRRTSQPFLSTLSAPAPPSITALYADPRTPDWIYIGLSTGRVHLVHLPIFVNESWKPMALAPFYLDPPEKHASSVISISTHSYYPGLLLVGYENGTIQLVDLERKAPMIHFISELEYPIPTTKNKKNDSTKAAESDLQDLETLVNVHWKECPDARYIVAAYSSSRLVIWDLAGLKDSLKKQKMDPILSLHALYSTIEKEGHHEGMPPASALTSSDSLPVQVTPPVYRSAVVWFRSEDRSSDLFTLYRAGGAHAAGLSLTLVDVADIQARISTQKKSLASYYAHLSKEQEHHTQSKIAMKAKLEKEKVEERKRLKKEQARKEQEKVKNGKIPRSQLKSKGLPIKSESESESSSNASASSEEKEQGADNVDVDDFESALSIPKVDIYEPTQRSFWQDAGSILDFALYNIDSRSLPPTLSLRACDIGLLGIAAHSTMYFYHPKELVYLVTSLDLPMFHNLPVDGPGAGELPLRHLFFPIIASDADQKIVCAESVIMSNLESGRSLVDDLMTCQEPTSLSEYFPSFSKLRPNPIVSHDKKGHVKKKKKASESSAPASEPALDLVPTNEKLEKLWIFGMDDGSLVMTISDAACSYYRPIYRLVLPTLDANQDSPGKDRVQIRCTHLYLNARRLVVETTIGDLFVYTFSWRAKTGPKEVVTTEEQGWSDAAPIWLTQRIRLECGPGFQPFCRLRLKSEYQNIAKDLRVIHHERFNILCLSLGEKSSQILSLKEGRIFSCTQWFSEAGLNDLVPEPESLGIEQFMSCSLGPENAPIEMLALSDGRLVFLESTLSKDPKKALFPSLTILKDMPLRHSPSNKLLGLYLLNGSGESRQTIEAPWRNDLLEATQPTKAKISSLDDLLNDYLNLDKEETSETQLKTMLVVVREYNLNVFSMDILTNGPADTAEDATTTSSQKKAALQLKATPLASRTLSSSLTHAVIVNEPASAPILLLGRLPKSILVYSLFRLDLLSEFKLKDSISDLAQYDTFFEPSGTMVLKSDSGIYSYYELFREPGLDALQHQRIGRYEDEAASVASRVHGTILAATASLSKIRIPRRRRSLKGGSEEWSDLVAPLLPYEMELLFSQGTCVAKNSTSLAVDSKVAPMKPPPDLHSSIPSLSERKKLRAKEKLNQENGPKTSDPYDKTAILTTAQKVNERNDKLKSLAKSCGQMEDQSDVFYTKIHAMNRSQANKKWYQI